MPPTSRANSVPVEVIRQALDDSAITPNELARRMGWFKTQPDASKVRRALGERTRGGGRPLHKAVTYRRALELIEAMGLDPVDYGL